MIVSPNAKINLGLNIVSRRVDGYHNLETVFFPVSLCDKLLIESLPQSDDILFQSSGNILLDCPPEDNLIVRTCRMFQEKKHIGGVSISLEKHIPFGAGLGGGSSDAAHTALALNQLFGLGLGKDELKCLVSPLGADCAFFIENMPCYAEGIGDVLSPVTGLQLDGYKLLLIKPDISVSTKEAYAGVAAQPSEQDIRDILRLPVEEWRGRLCNGFERTVFLSHPELKAIKQRLYDAGAAYASMSGSGSCMFGIFRNETPVDELAIGADCFVFTQSLSSC